jgi:hypothetical protein
MRCNFNVYFVEPIRVYVVNVASKAVGDRELTKMKSKEPPTRGGSR